MDGKILPTIKRLACLVFAGLVPLTYAAPMASPNTFASSFFLSVVRLLSTLAVKRGSSVETARSMSARLALISWAGVGGGFGGAGVDAGFAGSSSCILFSDFDFESDAAILKL